MGRTIIDEDGNRKHVQGKPWSSGGRFRYHDDAELARDAARTDGLDAKIKRQADDWYMVKTRKKSDRRGEAT